MSVLFDRPGFGAHICRNLLDRATLAEGETDGMRLIQLLSGVLVETLLLFDDPDVGLETTYERLAQLLDCEPFPGPLGPLALPPPHVLDYETELGRTLARQLFEEWLNCAYEFHDLIVFITHSMIMKLEQEGQSRSEVFRVFIECANRCMAFEIAAQELCDVVIEEKIGGEGWTLGDCVSGLSAVAGRLLAVSETGTGIFKTQAACYESIDHVAHVMMQEAVRLGIPAGSNWRFGLPANDVPVSAPYDLIDDLEPVCSRFFPVIALYDLMDQAVACAKAAGRMLAVAAGGEAPELEPVIAKPLAMAALTETYRSASLSVAVGL